MPQPIKNATPKPDSAAAIPPLNASNATTLRRSGRPSLEQALDDLGLPEDLVTEIEGRLRSQAIDTDMFTQLGCDLTGKKIVVVKSAQHFYASYAQLARRVIYVTAPGSVTQDLKSLPFRKIKRPKWPL